MRVFIWSCAAIAVFGATAACSPAAPQPSLVASTPSTAPSAAPAVTPPPATVASNPTPSEAPATPDVETLAPPTTAAGATTFHLVIEDGPKAGTWDVSSEHPTACSYVGDLDKWNISYLGLPPLSFIDGGLAEDFSTLLITFDSNTPDAAYFRSLEDLTFEVVDTGSTATISVDAPAMDVRFEDESPSEQTGHVELTVECAAPFRYE